MRVVRLLAAAGIGVALVAVSACESNTAVGVADPGMSAAAQDAGDSTSSGTFRVGDFVKLGGYTVKVNSVKNPLKPSDPYFQPGKGKKWVAVNVSVKNTSDEPQGISSLVCFNLRDASGQAMDVALVPDLPRSPDGEVAPGRFIKGTIAYEVPKNSKGLVLEFKCDLFSQGTAYIALD